MKRRYVLLGAIAGLCIALGTRNAEAQISSSFSNTMKNMQYVDLPATRTTLAASSFQDPTTGSNDPDDGYYYNGSSYGYLMPFQFEFDGNRYSKININVNGFVTFTDPPLRLGADSPSNLFRKDPPNAVIAPYWGNHYYRTGSDIGFVPSEISVKVDGVSPSRVLTVEWKKMNINYRFNPLNVNEVLSTNATPQPSSVGTFQLKIYESPITGSLKVGSQGDIEFYYSVVGDGAVPGVIKTSQAAIGIESASAGLGGGTSFLNGMFVQDITSFAYIPGYDSPDSVMQSTRLTSTWAPSRANNNVIAYLFVPRPGINGWGDGDANLSQIAPSSQSGKGQLRWVTSSDAITIMRADAINIPLDNLRFRNAYHGDVNHNGRYYFSTRKSDNSADSLNFSGNLVTWRRNIDAELRASQDALGLQHKRASNEFDALPADNSRTTIFYEATSFDAALILDFTAGKITTLPWLIDPIHDYAYPTLGASTSLANGVQLNYLMDAGYNTYKIPVYLNGISNGPTSLTFDVNAQIIDVKAVLNGSLFVQYNGNRVVIAGSGFFTADEPVAFVTVSTNEKSIKLSNVNLNDDKSSDVSIETTSASDNSVLSNNPNPVENTTMISMNVSVSGNYTLNIYDMLGNVVKSLNSGKLNAGVNTFNWDVTDVNGNKVNAGMYIYRLEGEGQTFTNKMVVR